MRPEVRAVLDGLSPTEKSEALQHAARELEAVHAGLELTPGVRGGSPRIAGARIPVWVLESYRRLGVPDDESIEMYPPLTPVDFAAAWAFVARFPEIVDRDLREQDRKAEIDDR